MDSMKICDDCKWRKDCEDRSNSIIWNEPVSKCTGYEEGKPVPGIFEIIKETK